MPEVRLPRLANLTGAPSADGTMIMLTLTAKDGSQLGVALDRVELSKAVGFMLGLAASAGQLRRAELPEVVTANPVAVAGIAIAPGRTPTEALLSVQIGPLTLAFSTEPTTLVGMCKTLQSMIVPVRNAPKPN